MTTSPPTRLLIDWENDTPGDTPLKFTSWQAVSDYYGLSDARTAMARSYFATYPKGTLWIVRDGLGQRPHLLGANISTVPISTLQQFGTGPIDINFNGWDYHGNVNLSAVTSDAQAAQAVFKAINAHRQTLATLSGSIQSKITDFMGHFTRAQLYVESVQSGTMEVGGLVDGPGVVHSTNVNREIINSHTPQPGDVGYFSTANRIGQSPGYPAPEAMTESYGVLTVNNVTSGSIHPGEQLIGTNGTTLPLDTAIIAPYGTSGNEWLVNNAVDISGDFKVIAPNLTTQNNFFTGATANNDFIEIQPNLAFGYDANPSTLGYATGSAADLLGLSQARGAIDSSPGGQHESVNTLMNGYVSALDNTGMPTNFTQVQTNDPRLAPAIQAWVAATPGYTFV